MATINWTIDPDHTVIGFKIKHMMISSVRGEFKQFQGTVTSQDDDWTNAQVDITIQPASISTGVAERDAHLRSSDFFDVDVYKDIHFVSTKIEKIDDENFQLTGDLTIHGTTHPITLNVEIGGVIEDPFGNTRAGFTVTGNLSRKDFGLTWNGTVPGGNAIIGDNVAINCELEIIHK